MNRWISKRFIILYLSPALLVYAVFLVYPALDAFRVSLYEWSGFSLTNMRFVGLDNFTRVLRDQQLRLAAGNNIFLVLAGGFVTFSLALLFAASLSQGRLRGAEFFKTTIFAPYVISAVAVALLWSFIYNPTWGLLNTTLRAVGLDALAVPILAQKATAFPAVAFVVVWHSLGFYVILLFAGIQAIPSDFYDAARIDGASETQSFFYVTLPLLRDVLIIAVLYWIIGALKEFGIVYAMTRGRPAGLTHTISTYLYDWALPYYNSEFRLGYASAIAVTLFLVVVTISIVYVRLTKRLEVTQF